METRVVHVRQRGTLTLPARWRERYAIEDGDALTLVDLDGVIVITPRQDVVGKLSREIERLRDDAGIPLEDLIAGVREERQRYYVERLGKSE